MALILLGVPTGTYWNAMGGLFYNKQLLTNWLAQVHGAIDSTGVSGANGILTCLVIKYSGKKYIYTKCVVLSAIGAYFLFIGVYPQTGLGKDNPYTPWVALSGHTIFMGLLTGYILKKIYTFDSELTAIEHKLPSVVNKPECQTPGAKNNISSKKIKCFRKPNKL